MLYSDRKRGPGRVDTVSCHIHILLRTHHEMVGTTHGE